MERAVKEGDGSVLWIRQKQAVPVSFTSCFPGKDYRYVVGAQSVTIE